MTTTTNAVSLVPIIYVRVVGLGTGREFGGTEHIAFKFKFIYSIYLPVIIISPNVLDVLLLELLCRHRHVNYVGRSSITTAIRRLIYFPPAAAAVA